MIKIYNCFPKGANKVLTLSYDDGVQDDRRLLEIFNKYKIKGTFHLNYGLMDQESRMKANEIKELYQGHEVAAHTVNHPTIARIPSTMMIKEVLEDREGLESLVGYQVRGLSYPNGSYDERLKVLLPGLGIRYSRIVGDSENFNLPTDPYEWKATCHHNHKLMELGNSFVQTKKLQYLYLMYVWGHSYEFTRDNNWELMEEFCQLVSNQPDVWYATNIEIMDYLEAVERLRYSATCHMVYNPSAMSVWITVNDLPVEIRGGETKQLF